MATLIHPIDRRPDEIFAAFADTPYALWMDSADQNHPASRNSYIAVAPAEIIEARERIVTITRPPKQKTFEADPFETVEERMAEYDYIAEPEPHLPPFQGGAAGLFGYNLGYVAEGRPYEAGRMRDIPDMAIGIYTQVFAYDHLKKQGWLITHAPDEDTARTRTQWFVNQMESTSGRQRGRVSAEMEWKSNFTPERYRQGIQKVIDYIKAGDAFQVNLSQRYEATTPRNFDIFGHYEVLRRVNPAPYASFFNLGGSQIASASPEQFLAAQNGRVKTKPIKGTRPRLPDKKLDDAIKKALMESEKDRAENIMIVDLLRNDLSKSCKPDSISVDKLCALETFQSVHHLVSTVSGTLREGVTTMQFLKGCFPGGSITGAPKIRAMEIIEELEGGVRDAYTGSIGFIGFNGAMDSSILIRTLVYDGRKAYLSVGGGITADSDPADEYQETLHKAKAMFVSFKQEQQDQSSGAGTKKKKNVA